MMTPENLSKSEPEQYNPNLDAQGAEATSGGKSRRLYISVAAALVLGYAALPKGTSSGNDSGMSSVTPTFTLAAAAAPAAEDTTVKTPTVAKPATVRIAAPAAVPAPVVPAHAAAPVAPPPGAPEPAAAVAAPTNMTMSGKIDDENGRPLVGATVMLRGSSKGTSTDANGTYTLEVPTGNDNTLVFGYGGYDDEVVRSTGNKFMNVTLTPRAKSGKQRRPAAR